MEGNPPAAHLCNPRKLWPWLFHPTAEGETSWVALSWRASTASTTVWWQDPNDGFLVHRQLHAGQNVVWVSTADSQQIWTHFYPKWLLNGRQKTWSPSSQTLPKPTRSYKIFRMLPYEIPSSLTIFRTSLVDFPSSVFQQHGNNHPSSVVASTGRPAQWSSSSNVQSATFKFSDHLVMVAYNGALSP